jgi:CheY-like chemotaxis protein
MLAYSGRGHFDVRSISLSGVVREIDHLLTASISKKARVTLELEQNLPAVEADVAQMRQVIMNLLINASDALGDAPGSIRVRTGRETVGEPLELAYGHDPLAPGEYVFLEVSDDGCGMSLETRARLFEPFFTTKFAGRGLGLSAVQGIVRGHGGGVVLQTQLGGGTTVKVLFPKGDRPATNVASQSSNPPNEWTGNGLVLLVEDDARVRAVTELLLQDIGFQVVSVANGREGIAEFDRRADEVRLVVLDLTMPDLGGDEVLVKLRERRPGVPVLICSGYGQEEMRHRSSQGDASFLQKPYSAKALRSRLMELVGVGRPAN